MIDLPVDSLDKKLDKNLVAAVLTVTAVVAGSALYLAGLESSSPPQLDIKPDEPVLLEDESELEMKIKNNNLSEKRYKLLLSSPDENIDFGPESFRRVDNSTVPIVSGNFTMNLGTAEPENWTRTETVKVRPVTEESGTVDISVGLYEFDIDSDATVGQEPDYWHNHSLEISD